MSAHRRLQSLAKAKDSDAMSTNSSECAICLLSVAPCQSLFVAPCSHVWHYKCIRPLIEKEYPTFLCPNCRAIADLERDIEEDEIADDMWEAVPDEVLQGMDGGGQGQHSDISGSLSNTDDAGSHQPILPEIATSEPLLVGQPLDTVNTNTTSVSERPSTPPRTSGSWRRRKDTIPNLDLSAEARQQEGSETGSSSGSGRGEPIHDCPEGPMTPMNDAGPFLLDGRDGRMSVLRVGSLGPSVLSGHSSSTLPLSEPAVVP